MYVDGSKFKLLRELANVLKEMSNELEKWQLLNSKKNIKKQQKIVSKDLNI